MNAIQQGTTKADPINGGLCWRARGYAITTEASDLFFNHMPTSREEAAVLETIANGGMLRKSSEVMLSWKLQREGLLQRKYEGMDADDMLPGQNLDQLELTEAGKHRLAIVSPYIAVIPLGALVMRSNGGTGQLTKEITAAAVRVGDCLQFVYRGRLYTYDPAPVPWYAE